jgi:hypothetical protein
MNYYYEWPKTR